MLFVPLVELGALEGAADGREGLVGSVDGAADGPEDGVGVGPVSPSSGLAPGVVLTGSKPLQPLLVSTSRLIDAVVFVVEQAE